MIKTQRGERIAERVIWLTTVINVVLIHVLFYLSAQFRGINRAFREIPKGETVQDVKLTLFQTTFITDKAEYVSNNGTIITVAVILGISLLVMLVVLGVYFASHDKRNNEESS